jgi:hypothetical protein
MGLLAEAGLAMRGSDEPAVVRALSEALAIGRRHGGGAIFRPETSLNVCCDLGSRRDTARAPQPTAASHGLDQKAIGWPTP